MADYNATVGSLERTVLPAARRMAELRVVDEELAEPAEVDAVAKPLTAPHLVDAALLAAPESLAAETLAAPESAAG